MGMERRRWQRGLQLMQFFRRASLYDLPYCPAAYPKFLAMAIGLARTRGQFMQKPVGFLNRYPFLPLSDSSQRAAAFCPSARWLTPALWSW